MRHGSHQGTNPLLSPRLAAWDRPCSFDSHPWRSLPHKQHTCGQLGVKDIGKLMCQGYIYPWTNDTNISVPGLNLLSALYLFVSCSPVTGSPGQLWNPCPAWQNDAGISRVLPVPRAMLEGTKIYLRSATVYNSGSYALWCLVHLFKQSALKCSFFVFLSFPRSLLAAQGESLRPMNSDRFQAAGNLQAAWSLSQLRKSNEVKQTGREHSKFQNCSEHSFHCTPFELVLKQALHHHLFVTSP